MTEKKKEHLLSEMTGGVLFFFRMRECEWCVLP